MKHPMDKKPHFNCFLGRIWSLMFAYQALALLPLLQVIIPRIRYGGREGYEGYKDYEGNEGWAGKFIGISVYV